MSRSAALQVLQATDDELAGVRSRLSALESMIARDPELERLRESAAADRARSDAAEKAARAAEERATRLRHRADTAERRLYDGSIGNPQELLALQNELEGIRVLLGEEEAALLTAMEVAEEASGAAAGSEATVADRERRRAKDAGPNVTRLQELRNELTEAQAARDEAASLPDAAALALYTRLAGRLRPVVVRLVGDSCGGCRHGLGADEVRRVRAGDTIVQCPNCDRILVP